MSRLIMTVKLDDDTFIQIVQATLKRDAGKQGVHRLMPTQAELQDAIDIAARDGFQCVYVHTDKTWPAKKGS